MPGRPDFSRFFYRAARGRQRGAGAHRHATGSRHLPGASSSAPLRRGGPGPGLLRGRPSGVHAWLGHPLAGRQARL